MTGTDSLAERIKRQAHILGFDLAGIAPATEADGFAHLQRWLAAGYAGEMAYMQRYGEARRHPSSILPNVRSVVMVALNYAMALTGPERDKGAPLACASGSGRVSVYARGEDYHAVLRRKLDELLSWVRNEMPEVQGRGVVDTAPLLERDFARRAGLGWFGKNTMLLNKKLGSWLFLGALLLDLDLPADVPFAADHCGTCTACLDACPTHAFVAPHVLDARRCISYLTIELKGSVPEELREPMGEWIFGCDVCQDVCPWNRKAPPGTDPAWRGQSDLDAIDLVELLGLSDEEFRRRFRHTPLWRAKRRGMARNAAIVLGNIGDASALPALRQALTDPEPVVREAAQWAIDRCTVRASCPGN